MPATKKRTVKKAIEPKDKSLESWIWDAETYRPIAEIVEELEAIEAEARETDKALSKILKQLGV